MTFYQPALHGTAITSKGHPSCTIDTGGSTCLVGLEDVRPRTPAGKRDCEKIMRARYLAGVIDRIRALSNSLKSLPAEDYAMFAPRLAEFLQAADYDGVEQRQRLRDEAAKTERKYR